MGSARPSVLPRVIWLFARTAILASFALVSGCLEAHPDYLGSGTPGEETDLTDSSSSNSTAGSATGSTSLGESDNDSSATETSMAQTHTSRLTDTDTTGPTAEAGSGGTGGNDTVSSDTGGDGLVRDEHTLTR